METNNVPTDLPQVAIDAADSVVEERAFLHDDPAAYRAGARDALEAVARLSDAPPDEED